jgi:serine/threonine protein kinase
MSNWVGQTLGKVRIDTLLARGGTAEVYVGTHTTLQREVAIKVLHANYDDHPHALERFQREAMVVGKLRHPNIVQVFDFDTTTDSHPYLVMEYIKGPSLLKYLNSIHSKDARLEFHHVVRLMNALTSALQYAHDSGVVHRDIKPGNVLLTSRSSDVSLGKPLPADFEPVLTDFGLVRFIDSTQHTTGSGQIAGTPAYMSPEQARGDLTDGRTDIYSLGIVLYEILAGHLPFEAETTMGVLMKHISEPPAPIPGLPPTMQYVLDRALAKKLDERFQTPSEFAEAFTAAVENRDDHSTLDMLSTTPIKRPAKKIFGQPVRPRRWMGPAIAGVVIVALGSSLFASGAFAPDPTVTPTHSVVPTLSALPSSTSTSTQTPAPLILLGHTGVLQFQNTSAGSRAVLIAEALVAPPPGNRYEVWLANGNQRLSLGILTLDATGQGQLAFDAAENANLVSQYDTVEVTIEPDPDTNPQTSGIIAYSFTLPEAGLTHLRYLLVSYPTTPERVGLMQGLYSNIRAIHELAAALEEASADGDEDMVRSSAAAMQNVIVGKQSPQYIDSDGVSVDVGDGFGLLLNGTNQGYLPATFAETEAVLKSADATEQMQTNGEGLKSILQNLALWTSELQALLKTIDTATAGADTSQQVAEVIALAEKMLNGIDMDQDGKIEPIPGEGGAQAAYEAAYHMADMPLQAVGILNIGTGTPTFISVPQTGAGSDGDGNAAPTAWIPPGQQRTPPGLQDKTPHNNNNNNNNGGGNGNNGNP